MPRLFRDLFTQWLETQGTKPGVYQPGGIFGAPPLGWQLRIGRTVIVYRVLKEAPHSLTIVLIEREEGRQGLRSPFADLVRFLNLVRRSQAGIEQVQGHVEAVSWRPDDSLTNDKINAFYKRHLGVRSLRVEEGVEWVGGELLPFVPPLRTHRPDLLQTALALHQQGRIQEAQGLYHEILKHTPDNAVAVQWLATTHVQNGQYVEAMDLFARAIRLQPDYAEAHNNRGNALRLLCRFDEAIASFDRALECKPDYAEALNNRGIVLTDTERFEEALASFDRALELKPAHAEGWKNRGAVLRRMKQHAEALVSFERALALRPGDAQAINYRGNALKDLARYDESLACYDQALVLQPQYAEVYYNRSVLLREMNRLAEAMESCRRGHEVNPQYYAANSIKANLLLLQGDYEQGWALFERRWIEKWDYRSLRRFAQPLWLGEQDITGKTLLIHAEAGLGDVIQFSRYVPLMAAKGVKVVFDAPPSLAALFQSFGEGVEVIVRGQPLPPFDHQIPSMSLPLAFGTTAATIPAALPYLTPSRDKMAEWRQKLGTATRPRIGIACSGNPIHGNDHNRSFPLALFAPLLDIDAEFHCVQKVIRETDRATAAALPLKTWEADLHDFTDTAALLAAMDLVISVDTSVAHLAGALARPTWVLVPFAPDFRWMLHRDDSPWYPGVMRLFRQGDSRQWPDVIETVRASLSQCPFPL